MGAIMPHLLSAEFERLFRDYFYEDLLYLKKSSIFVILKVDTLTTNNN